MLRKALGVVPGRVLVLWMEQGVWPLARWPEVRRCVLRLQLVQVQ